METVINKVLITAEARFDYESEFSRPLPTADIKRETEEYINNKTVRFYGYYFRVKYLDETTDRMLMLFVYKAERFGCMQLWEVRGICPAEDWSAELEEDGQIREWLNSKMDTPEERGSTAKGNSRGIWRRGGKRNARDKGYVEKLQIEPSENCGWRKRGSKSLKKRYGISRQVY